MDSAKRNILVTGGAGFIGSAVCRHLIQTGGYRVVNVDKLTYAANPASLEEAARAPDYRFEKCDIGDQQSISRLLHEEQIDCVMHLAAETHVDRSIRAPAAFVETNIAGTFHLLQAVLGHWRSLGEPRRSAFRFHHVSTDEVFGDAGYGDKAFTPPTRYMPSSPYSASKAASDHLVMAWHRTYGLPVVISHSCNTYGPYQFPDKLIPLMILNALMEQPLPVYGTGENVRDWIHIDDQVRALELVLVHGRVGRTYQIAEPGSRSNLEVVRAICDLLDLYRPRPNGRRHRDLITFVPDRPGHDCRYALDPGKVRSELGWAPVETFESGLARTVRWYIEREDWWLPLQDAASQPTGWQQCEQR